MVQQALIEALNCPGPRKPHGFRGFSFCCGKQNADGRKQAFARRENVVCLRTKNAVERCGNQIKEPKDDDSKRI